jgi:hypothetical protein
VRSAARTPRPALLTWRRRRASRIYKSNQIKCQAYKEVVEILEAAGATEDAKETRTIHSGPAGGAAGEKLAVAPPPSPY